MESCRKADADLLTIFKEIVFLDGVMKFDQYLFCNIYSKHVNIHVNVAVKTVY